MKRYVSNRNHGDDTLTIGSAVAGARGQSVMLRFDESTSFFDFEYFGKADRLVFESGRDNATPSDNIFFFDLNNREFAGNTKQMTVDARALGGQLNGVGGLYEEFAFVGTTHVTTYTVKFLGGAGGDRFNSGQGGDSLNMGGGDDYVSIGAGDDTVRLGGGNDYVDSTDGDFGVGDLLDGGAGLDQLTYYGQGLSDALFANMRSIEILGASGEGTLELGENAVTTGIRELYVDGFKQQSIVLTSGFTGSLLIYHQGAAPGALAFDASASAATVTIEAGYDTTESAPTYVGGSGSEDTIKISNGYVFEGSPPHGGDLSNVTGFEHVLVEDLGGESGAYLILATATEDIAADFQTVDASTLVAGKAFDLDAAAATADLHITSGDADDRLVSGRGDDRIDGGLGDDTMRGGGGRDVFVYDAVTDSNGKVVDAVLDFRSGRDMVDVTGLGMDKASLSGAEITFFGNQDGGARDDRLFARTAADGVLDAVFRTDTHTLWFDTNDNGKLDASDLHLSLGATTALIGADVLDGSLVI